MSEAELPREEERPWDELCRLVEQGSPEDVQRFLEQLSSAERARAVSRLGDAQQSALMTTLEPGDAAELVEQLAPVQAAGLVELLPPDEAARIVRELPSDEQADLLGDLPEAGADAILDELEPAEAGDIRALQQYPDDVAGGLMVTEYLSFPESATVREVIDDLRAHADQYEDYAVQYAYVVGLHGRLVGVLRLRDLLLARGERNIGTRMVRDPLAVRDEAPLDELRDFFDSHPFLGVPVVGPDDRLLGVLHRSAVEEALSERSEEDYRVSQGIVGGDELRTMPVLLRSRRRLAWLSVNVLLNIAAASIIAAYEDTLSAIIALAVFLPIISDMSGCSGSQAVAVSLRELTLGLVRDDELLRVWRKEVAVGAINGLALGALVASAAWLWKGNVYLGAVVGAALALNTIVAVSVGGLVPLLLRRLRLDPALASGPILTTVTDMCGFFLALSFAGAALPHMQGI